MPEQPTCAIGDTDGGKPRWTEVVAVVVTNLAKGPLRRHCSWSIAGGGVLFSPVRLGNVLLMFATASQCAIFVFLYPTYRNLWLLGLSCGWLAGLFYLWFLHRDPLTEIFGRLVSPFME